jgi:hypothetical protein
MIKPSAVLSVSSQMKLSALLLPALLSAGCSSLNTHFEPKAEVGQLKHIYVVESLNDNHDLHEMIVRNLQGRGFQAESGPLTLMPPSAKAYLVYEDQWDWDFRNYLIALTVTLRDARSDHLLANASYFRPTAFLKTPQFMVQTVLEGLFKPGAKLSPAPAINPPTDEPEKGGGRRS